jgi:hypothetical protein
MQAVRQWVLIFVLAVALIGFRPAQRVQAFEASTPGDGGQAAPEMQTAALTMTVPSACPPSGCAAGQRLGMRFGYSLTGSNYDPPPSQNLKVCIYASDKWHSTATDVSNGELSGIPYSQPDPADSNCQQDTARPAGYDLIVERVAALVTNTSSDALRFSFRLGTGATGTGSVIAHLFVLRSGAWVPFISTESAFLEMADTPISTSVYVASNGSVCGSNMPCYINSDGGDSISAANDAVYGTGLGTGLKDAIDAVNAGSTIYVLGNYTVKAYSVHVTKKLTITGVNNATITYTGSSAVCEDAILTFDSPATLTGLNIDDGNCSSPNRDLLEISGQAGSTDPVSILSNDLSSGENAIVVHSANPYPLIIRYNEITANSGHSVYFDSSGTSALELTANNLQGNSFLIQCGLDATTANRKANHNYWGGGSPISTDSNCTIDPAKRLGGPIVHNAATPGVRAQRVTVGTNRGYSFDNQVSYNRSGSGGSDFDMYIVDYGYMPSSGTPFTQSAGGESVSPCSNYWDVYLADGAAPTNTLELYFKYFNHNDETPGCVAAINSSLYCDQDTDYSEDYPLFWYDPGIGITEWWDTVGEHPGADEDIDGQTVTCHISSKEIQVSIDGSGRPSLTDLGYSPFVVGVPVIKSFKPLASNQSVSITWATNAEPDISGFYVLWGTDQNNLERLYDAMTTHTGTSTTGKTYSLPHPNRINGTTYYYRLEVVRTDDTSFYSEIFPIKVAAATPIPPTKTFTPTAIQPTKTLTATKVNTQKPTTAVVKSATPQKTATPSRTSLVLATLTKTLDIRTPGVAETLAVLSLTPKAQNTPAPQKGTPGASLNETPGVQGSPGEATETEQPSSLDTPTVSPTPEQAVAGASATNNHPWLSLLLGLLAGLVLVGGTGGWWYRTKMK